MSITHHLFYSGSIPAANKPNKGSCPRIFFHHRSDFDTSLIVFLL